LPEETAAHHEPAVGIGDVARNPKYSALGRTENGQPVIDLKY
jgi:hypothetical protein